jgi:23S rRNA (guanosine2251-2'-O)-methyltransferase
MAYNKSYKPSNDSRGSKDRDTRGSSDSRSPKDRDTRGSSYSRSPKDRDARGSLDSRSSKPSYGFKDKESKGSLDRRGSKPSYGSKDRDNRGSSDRYASKSSFTSHDRKDFYEERARQDELNSEQPESLQLEGRNSLLEALSHDKVIDKILIKQGEVNGTLRVIVAKAIEKGIIVQEVSRIRLDEISETGNHQGVIGMCPAQPYFEIEDMLAKAKAQNQPPFLIILDEITDPHNLGAIIRSADACGAHGVIIPKRRAVGLTGVVSKTSAGAIEHVMVARVNSIVNVIEMLKKQNIWVACADMKGQTVYNAQMNGAIAVVIGSEGNGVGRLIREKCDFTVKIPMQGKIASLNASVAAGIVLYEVVRQRHHVK